MRGMKAAVVVCDIVAKECSIMGSVVVGVVCDIVAEERLGDSVGVMIEVYDIVANDRFVGSVGIVVGVVILSDGVINGRSTSLGNESQSSIIS